MNGLLRIGAVLPGAMFVAIVHGAPASPSLGVPGRGNDNVSLAAARDLVVAVWTATLPGGGSDVVAAVSHDAGLTFAAPVRVNAREGDAKTNGEQPPRVAIVERGATSAIVVVWTAPGNSGTRILSAESTDGGKTYGAPMTVAEAAGNRGWESLAVDRSGRAWVLWLDHRQAARKPATATATPAGHEHQHQPPASAEAAVARAQLSQLMITALRPKADAAKSLTGGVCYCCKTALATAADGTIYAAWRHVYPGNHRDIAFTVSRDAGRSFAPPMRVSDDSWEINGCPENGPAIAVDARGWVHVVWPTLVSGSGEPQLALFWAMSRDGKTFSKRQQIATAGQPFHPQVVIDRDGSLIVAWDEVVNGRRQVSFARGVVDATGTARFAALGMPHHGSYPALAVTGRGPVAAWTNRSAALPMIETARLGIGLERTE